MKSFLSVVAADLLAHFSNDMRDVLVVFPSKRAGMFLSRELALLGAGPVWTPQYCTMNDLFLGLSPLREADQMECVCQLYAIMQEVLGADYGETIDEFWSWGEVLMSDFDDIDKHLADAKAIFANIADQESLKSLDYLDVNQRETLRRFFGRFSLENSTRIQKKFLQTWSHMYEIYTRLHERLFREGKLWEGALYRHVAEQMQKDDVLVRKLLEGKRAVVFAGFNVLNDVEHTMMRLVQREGKARFYWDYDIYYTTSGHEAGDFMVKNLKDFPSAISGEEAFDNFSHLRDVTFIACTTDNAAARYVNTYINEELKIKNEDSAAALNSSTCQLAIVLGGEGLMQPVLHSIPETVRDVNVTMGFPLSDTPVYGIVMSLLKLQIEGYDTGRSRFRHPFVQTLRRQPLFALLREEDTLVYHGCSSVELLEWMLLLVRQIARHYAQIEEPDVFEQLYSEATFRIDRMLTLTRDQLSSFKFQLSPLTLRRLLRQMMISAKIPFHSEPDRGLQVMGMLETRCLSFDHLLLLSAEEGNLPRSPHANSFIPESLRDAFGLTTQKHRTALYAYYFYRLVSRCEHLTCVYNESQSDGVQHEMSRFLRQMLAETDIPIRTLWIGTSPAPLSTPQLVVEKSPEVMECLLHRYDQNLPNGEHIMLSPSAINSYLACPMQFYLNNVMHIRREDDPQEGISADIIGDIFHDAAQAFYERLRKHYGTNTITADMLHHDTKVLESMLDEVWSHYLPSDEAKGTALIVRHVLLRYLHELVRYDARHAPFRIVATEEERSIEMELEGVTLKVGGRIDRIDEMDGRLRIVDYKTGTYKLKAGVKMENVVGSGGGHEPYYLQTFLYALAEMERNESSLPVKPILFFPIKAASADYDPSLRLGGEVVDDFASQHAEVFRQGLQTILEDIFNPEKPFTCTTQADNCKYCKLGLICGKQQ